MTIWRVVANYVLPIPLALFLLLSLPLPKNVRQGIILFVQRVFDLPVVGVFKLLHIMVRRGRGRGGGARLSRG